MITSEKAEHIAQNLLKTANMLNAQMSMLDSMAKEGWQAIKDEVEAYETIILSGEDVVHGLKTIAVNYQPDIKSLACPSRFRVMSRNGTEGNGRIDKNPS